MAWSDLRVDAGLWNLCAVAAVAGCGPLIPVDGMTDGGPDDDGDPTDDGPWTETVEPTTTSYPDTDTSTDTDPSTCDCEPGYVCIDGACIWEGDCTYESGGYGYCCYDGCYYTGCDHAEDCGPGFYCDGDECDVADALPACDPDGALRRAIPLPVEANGAVALAFGDVEAGGGEEMLVVREGEAQLLTNGGTAITGPVALVGVAGDISAAATSTGSGIGFAVSAPADGVRLVTLQAGVLAAGERAGYGQTRIASGDFDSDGIDDVIGREGPTLRWLPGTGTGFGEHSQIHDSVHGGPVVADFSGDGVDDVAFHRAWGESEVIIDVASGGGDSISVGSNPVDQLTLAALDLNADGWPDIAGAAGWGGTLLLFGWLTQDGAFEARSPYQLPDLDTDEEGVYDLAVGDMDGDGIADVVFGSGTVVRIVFVDPLDTFRCYADIPIPHAATALAVGDLDGDGRADVAFSDGMTTSVLAHL